MLQYTHRFGKHLLLEFQLNHFLQCSTTVLASSLSLFGACHLAKGSDTAVQAGLSSHNVIINRLGSRWSAHWSLMISSLNGSQYAHSWQGLVDKSLFSSSAVQLYIDRKRNGKLSNANDEVNRSRNICRPLTTRWCQRPPLLIRLKRGVLWPPVEHRQLSRSCWKWAQPFPPLF